MHPAVCFNQLLHLGNSVVSRTVIHVNQFKIEILFLKKGLVFYKLVVKVPYIFFFIVAGDNCTQ